MKPLLTLLGASAFSLLNAQTITSANAPTIGYAFTRQTSAWYEPLSTGTDQTWDMSAATPSGGAEVFYYILPSLAPGAAAFPNADVALQPAGALNTATFIDVQPDGLYGLGTFDNGGPVTVLYSDVENTMRYPCSLGTTWTDDVAYETSVDGNPLSTGVGTSTYTADGTGTLILPNGTYTDVIRITHTSSETAESFGTTYLTTKDEVIFRRPGTQEVLASTIHHVYYTNGAQSGELFQSYYLVPLATSTPAPDMNGASITLFPNPASNIVFVRANTPDGVGMIVTDALGRSVHTNASTSALLNDGTIAVDVSTWAKGVYHVTIRDTNGLTATQRLMVH